MLAPLEDPLEEGEVHVREELDEDTPDLKHATDVPNPTADQVEKHKVTHLPYSHGANNASWDVVWDDPTASPPPNRPCLSLVWIISSSQRRVSADVMNWRKSWQKSWSSTELRHLRSCEVATK